MSAQAQALQPPVCDVADEEAETAGPRERTSVAPAPGGVPVGLERPRFVGTRPRRRAYSLVVRASVPLILLGAWWLGARAGVIPESMLASPGDVAVALLELARSGDLARYLGASLTRALLGVGLGVSAGLFLGVAAGLSALSEELIDPSMQMLRAVPSLAMVPLLISWFGIDETFKIALIGLSCAMPMYAYSYLGVRNVDRKLVEAARSFGLRRGPLLRHIVLPSALPSLLMALRICLALSLLGLIAAEQVGTTKGIGYLVLLAKQYYRQDYMVLCLVLYAGLGLLYDAFIRVLERTLMPWRRHTTLR